MIRSIIVIGALWPICKCGHIAQEHDNDKCGHIGKGQCPCCGNWSNRTTCSCNGYSGPSWEEFKEKYLTPEEITYYKWR